MLELSQCYRHAAEGGAFDLPNGKEPKPQPPIEQAPVHPVAVAWMVMQWWEKDNHQEALSPEGPARHLDVSRQKLSPHCLETIFDSQLPSPKLSPKLSLSKRGLFPILQDYPCGEGNCVTIERQKLSCGNFCSTTSRCLFWPIGNQGALKPEGDKPKGTNRAQTQIFADSRRFWQIRSPFPRKQSIWKIRML